ncbi:hypothetical protein QO058_25995 [Bosea vestrisii]|uniref:hypothetical protein n=1 Tax=Bosea vestrisii TaxID=151416 RepID=UPI0024DFE115|nr:hypothetical protein [Bosea vestrisii]WID96147.1 hypothetical protein QO058_25995 [Bosea vestrisii]
MAKAVAVHAVYLEDSTMIHEFNLKRIGPDGLETGHAGIRESFSPRKAVDEILYSANVAGGNRIKILRLLAHGDAGEFNFPGLKGRSSIAREYGGLRGAFAPLARIEIHGCGCASEKDLRTVRDPQTQRKVEVGQYTGDPKGRGLLFLYAVARTFNVPVTGGVDSQGPWDGWSYSGVTVTISPAGKFYAEKPGQRWWDPSSADEEAGREFRRIQKQYIDKKLYVEARIALRVLMATYPTSKEARDAERLVPLGGLEALDKPPPGMATKFE